MQLMKMERHPCTWQQGKYLFIFLHCLSTYSCPSVTSESLWCFTAVHILMYSSLTNPTAKCVCVCCAVPQVVGFYTIAVTCTADEKVEH